MPSSRTERLQALYLQMCRIRCTEEALGRLWHRGLVSGEMHLGLGEEAVVAAWSRTWWMVTRWPWTTAPPPPWSHVGWT